MVNYWLISGLRENLEVGIRIKMWAFHPEKAKTKEDITRFFEFLRMMCEGDFAALRVVEFRAGRMLSARVVGFVRIGMFFTKKHTRYGRMSEEGNLYIHGRYVSPA